MSSAGRSPAANRLLGITQSHSWPHVSDDNSFSKAQFKTLKYRPNFPEQFRQHTRQHPRHVP